MNRHSVDNDDRSISFDEVGGLSFEVTSPGELHVFADSDRWDHAHHFRGARDNRFASSDALGIGNLLLDSSQSESMLSNADNDPLGWSGQANLLARQDKPGKARLVSCLKKRQDSNLSILSTTSSGASSIISCAEEPGFEASGHGRAGFSTASKAGFAAAIGAVSPFDLQTKLECHIDSTLQYSLNSSAVPPKNPQRCESLGLTARSAAGDRSSRFDAPGANADDSSYRDSSKRHVHFSTRISTHSFESRVE
jgi:hypothetical protein